MIKVVFDVTLVRVPLVDETLRKAVRGEDKLIFTRVFTLQLFCDAFYDGVNVVRMFVIVA